MKQYFAGSARVEITPPLSMPYLAFCPRHMPFEKVMDPLFVTALYLRAEEEICLLAVDGIGIADTIFRDGSSFYQKVRKAASERSGIPENNILVHSAHIHSSPDTIDFRPMIEAPGAAEYLNTLVDSFVAAVENAKESAFPAAFTLFCTACPDVSLNRRGDPWHNQDLHILRFSQIGGPKRILAAHFACHPVVMQVQSSVTAEYVGAFRREMEGEPDTTCLFLQGACGDQNPVTDDSRKREDFEMLGARLAAAARCALAGPGVPQDVSLRHAYCDFSIPSRPLLEEEGIKALARKKESLGKEGDIAALSRLGEIEQRLAEGEQPFPARVSVLAIGSLRILTTPVEPLNKMSYDWQALAGEKPALVLGYTDGYLGYVAQPELWEIGGYEAGGDIGPWGKLYRYAFDDLLAAGAKLL